MVEAGDPGHELLAERIELARVVGGGQRDAIGGGQRRGAGQLEIQCPAVQRSAGHRRALLPCLAMGVDHIRLLVLRGQHKRVLCAVLACIRAEAGGVQHFAPLAAQLQAQIEPHVLIGPAQL
jgi:hypothetical protein